MTYPSRGSTQSIAFANDAAGRRTDTWLAPNADHSTWASHTHVDYDPSGRVTHVLGETAKSGGGTYIVQNQTQCYAAGSTPPTCPTTPSSDRSKIQWINDTRTGEMTAYGYDGLGRLTKVTVTGGSNPRTYTYSYDAAGNRLTANVTGSITSSQTLSFNWTAGCFTDLRPQVGLRTSL